jgi:acyl-coenzyme A synthetase/AMP-(fatty) acid ligase
VHCLKLSGARLILVDGDEVLRARIEEVRGAIEGELRMEIAVEDDVVMGEIRSQSHKRIEDAYREGVKGDWPMGMLYTSGTTGMPKGVSFTTDRQWLSAAAVRDFCAFHED